MQCVFIRKSGRKCNAYATKSSRFCFVHNPENEEKHREATVKGGKSSYKNGFLPLDPIDLTKPVNIIYMIADTANRIRKVDDKGCMDISTANCLAILSSRLMEAQKVLELEKENKDLKEKIRKFNIPDEPDITDEELAEELRALCQEDAVTMLEEEKELQVK